MKHFIFTILFFAFASCQNSNTAEKTSTNKTNQLNKADSSKTCGYWQIPNKSRFVKVKNGMLSNGNHLFYYDGKYITLSLLTLKGWMWKSEDDFYKLKANWQLDSLFYLPPFAKWTYLAKFDGTNFSVTLQDTVGFKYEKIEPNEISKTDSSILKKRDLHKYNIKPTDKGKQ